MTTPTPRRMGDAAYRAQQQDQRYADHIAPVNHFIDNLIEEDAAGRGRWMPHVAPIYSSRARVLSVLRDPGPATQSDGGSGMLSIENDDPTAAFLCDVQMSSGLTSGDLCPWNIAPWYRNAAPRVPDLIEGGEILLRLLDVLTSVRYVMLHGNEAWEGWTRLEQRNPSLQHRFTPVRLRHGGRQSFIHKDPAVKAMWREDFYTRYRDVAASI